MNITRRGLFGWLAVFTAIPPIFPALKFPKGAKLAGPLNYTQIFDSREDSPQSRPFSVGTKFEWGPDQWLTYDEGE